MNAKTELVFFNDVNPGRSNTIQGSCYSQEQLDNTTGFGILKKKQKNKTKGMV